MSELSPFSGVQRKSHFRAVGAAFDPACAMADIGNECMCDGTATGFSVVP
jgi:hypothetical protein